MLKEASEFQFQKERAERESGGPNLPALNCTELVQSTNYAEKRKAAVLRFSLTLYLTSFTADLSTFYFPSLFLCLTAFHYCWLVAVPSCFHSVFVALLSPSAFLSLSPSVYIPPTALGVLSGDKVAAAVALENAKPSDRVSECVLVCVCV